MSSPLDLLAAYRGDHDFLVCIDSDGCAFDTMGIKQRECFCPWMIAYFGLQPVAKAARACKEFADLFSKTRGANRHLTIKRILTELLPTHPEVLACGFEIPQYPAYMSWIDNPESALSNEGLEAAIAAQQNPTDRRELELVLEWSRRVNWAVAEIVHDLPPFVGVREALQTLDGRADVVVVSATPLEALEREWTEHGLVQYARLICGQEMGTKRQHIATVGAGYERTHILMIGDAPGDLRAAEANNVLFYPIIPGNETDSWKAFVHEGLDRFVSSKFHGAFQERQLEAFDRALPVFPPWKEGR